MMEPGIYHGTLLSAQTGTATTGTPLISLRWRVEHQSVNGAWQEINAVERDMFWFLSEKALKYTQDRLAKVGFNGDYGNPQFTPEPVSMPIMCDHETYEGKIRERWSLDESGPIEFDPLAADKIRQLNAKWKNDMGKSSAPKPSGAPPTPPAAPSMNPEPEAAPTGKDIPF